ncbi:hypothetical protein SGLAM104S_02986 [Streptomyces glaucescens]
MSLVDIRAREVAEVPAASARCQPQRCAHRPFRGSGCSVDEVGRPTSVVVTGSPPDPVRATGPDRKRGLRAELAAPGDFATAKGTPARSSSLRDEPRILRDTLSGMTCGRTGEDLPGKNTGLQDAFTVRQST